MKIGRTTIQATSPTAATSNGRPRTTDLAIHLDTNVLLWLAQKRATVLGAQAFRLAAKHAWVISPAVILELEVLHEIKRVRVPPDRILADASEAGDLSIAQTPYAEVVQAARSLSWTRDPIDRLVTAAALADGTKLLTADKTILAHFPDAVWD